MSAKGWRVASAGLAAALLVAITVTVTLAVTPPPEAPPSQAMSQATGQASTHPALATPADPAPEPSTKPAPPRAPKTLAETPPSPEPTNPVPAPTAPPAATVEPLTQATPKTVQCPRGHLQVRGGKVQTRPVSENLYAVEYRGTLTNSTTRDVFMSRTDPPDLLALADNGETITIVSSGNFQTTRTDGTPVPDDFVLAPGQAVTFQLAEDSVFIDREVANWFDDPRVGSMTAEWNDADIYRCPSPLQPAD